MTAQALNFTVQVIFFALARNIPTFFLPPEMKACLEKARDMSGWDKMAAKMLERNVEEQNGKLVGLEESLVQLLLASGAECPNPIPGQYD
ncbi:MAG: hypothetical protein WA118_13170 [Carboxydocellales bacterium]